MSMSPLCSLSQINTLQRGVNLPTPSSRASRARIPLALPSPAPARLCPHFALRGPRASPRRARPARPA